ncbi:MAG: Lrp/AsnC family transcriptional regulator [Cypionkella sp.]|uniref:Lrp/AsnC family transcriptional regulator n=1 Tax=Cypionkella sp. TaxID=2811411 RepID=UPI002ABB48B9|nr:Lrp/AsnC family transcriptional regulator [Cypionkella sp.]MDZ4311525.1 Lrp/AsnC family transcriptional regulator [Cypionkella sp.]MDZ4393981.1 Lrp/AsnC family transcriptional regulator [Cypionkella sp.]
MQLDDSDRRILKALQEQPDLTLRELGEITGLSHSPCWRRLQRLQEAGAISARRFVVDPEAIGFEILVFCFVKISHHQRDRLKAFEDAVAKVPEVMQCYSLSGEYDYVLQVIATSVREYEATVKNALVELPNVQSINTSFTLKRIKNSLNVPL